MLKTIVPPKASPSELASMDAKSIEQQIKSYGFEQLFKKDREYNKTAVHYGAANKNPCIVSVLGSMSTQWRISKSNDVFFFLQEDTKNSAHSVLEIAVENHNIDMAKLLVTTYWRVADCNRRKAKDKTAFRLAIRHERTELLILFQKIDKGFESDDTENTIFHESARLANPGTHPTVLEFLLANKKKFTKSSNPLEETNRTGQTVLDIAQDCKNSAMIDWIQNYLEEQSTSQPRSIGSFFKKH